jgi:hypothetical protein
MGAVLGHDGDVHRGDILCYLLATNAAPEDHRIQQALLATYLSQAQTRLSISYGEDSHLQLGRYATASMRMRSPASSRAFQRFRRRTPRRQDSGSLVAARGSVSGRHEPPVSDAVAHDDREPGTTW